MREAVHSRRSHSVVSAITGFTHPNDATTRTSALDETTANSLNLQRRLGESISDVIIRLARQGALPG